ELLHSHLGESRQSITGLGIARQRVGEGDIEPGSRRVPGAQERPRGIRDAVVARAGVPGLRGAYTAHADDEGMVRRPGDVALEARRHVRELSDVLGTCADDRHVILRAAACTDTIITGEGAVRSAGLHGAEVL